MAVSTTPDKPHSLADGNPAYWSHELAVPECSQMVYPDGGTVWCSPTSVSMVLAYWQQETGPCEPRVRATVAGVFDPATTNCTSMMVLPLATNSFGGLKVLNSSV